MVEIPPQRDVYKRQIQERAGEMERISTESRHKTDQIHAALAYAAQGKYKIIYVAPERLNTCLLYTSPPDCSWYTGEFHRYRLPADQ